MQSQEDKVTYKWLEKHDLSYNDINYLIKLYKKEGIKFCRKSFDVNDFDDLRTHLKEQENSSFINYF